MPVARAVPPEARHVRWSSTTLSPTGNTSAPATYRSASAHEAEAQDDEGGVPGIYLPDRRRWNADHAPPDEFYI
jgi:hypothetical protein